VWGRHFRGTDKKNKSGDYEPHRDIVFKKLMIAGPYLEGKLK
jgi:hypothetical protein